MTSQTEPTATDPTAELTIEEEVVYLISITTNCMTGDNVADDDVGSTDIGLNGLVSTYESETLLEFRALTSGFKELLGAHRSRLTISGEHVEIAYMATIEYEEEDPDFDNDATDVGAAL
ncbi:MAG: hypothetical protein Q9169_006456 [Polycauliona sp. 2 TL-2023]